MSNDVAKAISEECLAIRSLANDAKASIFQPELQALLSPAAEEHPSITAGVGGLSHPRPHIALAIAIGVLETIAWAPGSPETTDRAQALADAAAEMATKPRRAVNWLAARAALHAIASLAGTGDSPNGEVP